MSASTVDVDVDRGRTAAATAARRRRHAERLAGELARRAGDLERPVLAALLIVLVDEAALRRGGARLVDEQPGSPL